MFFTMRQTRRKNEQTIVKVITVMIHSVGDIDLFLYSFSCLNVAVCETISHDIWSPIIIIPPGEIDMRFHEAKSREKSDGCRTGRNNVNWSQYLWLFAYIPQSVKCQQ